MQPLSSLLGPGDETKQRAYLGAGDILADGRRTTGNSLFSYSAAVLARVALAIYNFGSGLIGGRGVFGGVFGGALGGPGGLGNNGGLNPGSGVIGGGAIEH